MGWFDDTLELLEYDYPDEMLNWGKQVKSDGKTSLFLCIYRAMISKYNRKNLRNKVKSST